jgi:hypothetical protein
MGVEVVTKSVSSEPAKPSVVYIPLFSMFKLSAFQTSEMYSLYTWIKYFFSESIVTCQDVSTQILLLFVEYLSGKVQF